MSTAPAALAVVLLVGTSIPVRAAPCDGVDRTLTPDKKFILAHDVAPQLNVPALDVLGFLGDGAWSIVTVDTHTADEAFLFFAGDPASYHYVTLWSGAATHDEFAAIRQWVLANAPGIPERLASCFAWHVTLDRKAGVARMKRSAMREHRAMRCSRSASQRSKKEMNTKATKSTQDTKMSARHTARLPYGRPHHC